MMNPFTLVFLFAITSQLYSQSFDTTFFPVFEPYSTSPIINFGDGVPNSPWNDPVVLKNNDQYIMYMSGAKGGILHPNDTLDIYRFLSSDGYSWTIDPAMPVLKADSGTFYQGGVETPSVVYFNGQYHMYNTVYNEFSTQDVWSFRISHASSSDGISWIVDTTPVIEADTTPSWMSEIIAEPGAMVKNDTLYLFFTAIGFNGAQSIGLARSTNGTTFFDTIQAVTIPSEIYPDSLNYVGLSTPSAVMVGDTIYLFTDVAQTVLGKWTQVALHQFKCYGDIHKWYHDSKPIHTLHDFAWTDGNYLSEIRSITPLVDGNRLRIWYAGNHLSDIDTVANDTTYYVHFDGIEMVANDGTWGIGTSEYIFNTTSGIKEVDEHNAGISIQFNGKNGFVSISEPEKASLSIYSISGKVILQKQFYNHCSFDINKAGVVIIRVAAEKEVIAKKLVAY